MYLSNIVVHVCDLRHVEALTGVRTLAFTTVTFITNRAPRPTLGEWGDAYCPPPALGCSEGSTDYENQEFSSYLKMCTNSFYPMS